MLLRGFHDRRTLAARLDWSVSCGIPIRTTTTDNSNFDLPWLLQPQRIPDTCRLNLPYICDIFKATYPTKFPQCVFDRTSSVLLHSFEVALSKGTNKMTSSDGASSISVTVRVRPFTIREAAQLTKCDDSTIFLGDGSLAAAPTPKLSQKGLRSVIKVVDDKCL